MALHISIIGLGSRGISILEKILAYALYDNFLKKCNIELNLFDEESKYGCGTHSSTQPDNLLVNTVSSQMTVFSDSTVNNSHFLINGYYSRKLLGEYLKWSLDYLCSIAPMHITINICNEKVNSISQNGDSWDIKTDKNKKYFAHYVFITTGHEEEANVDDCSSKKLFPAYPIARLKDLIEPRMVIGIRGLGLTFFDVISDMTEGRGGKFIKKNNELRYIPSGKEPVMIGFSRSGLPFYARAKGQKELREQYKPRIITFYKIKELKKIYKKIDFQKHILPLIIQELELVYTFAFLVRNNSYFSAYKFENEYFLCDENNRSKVVEKYIAKESDRFNWEKLCYPIKQPYNKASYSRLLIKHIEYDLKNALEGNVQNPIKSASDVLRDIRDIIRFTIDFSSLTGKSHKWLNENFIPKMNRIAVGPPLSRVEQMLCLVRQNILRIDLGPGVVIENQDNKFLLKSLFGEKITVDKIIDAKISTLKFKESNNLLLNSLYISGIAKQFNNDGYETGGLTVNKNLNIIDNNGKVVKTIFSLGVPTEGCKFYTFILPRPFVNSTALTDAEKAVSTMVKHYKQHV